MFHPLGLFKKIQCPNNLDCNLQNCIFSHAVDEQENGVINNQVYDPFSAGDSTPPPSKRRRIESPEPGLRTQNRVETDTVSKFSDRSVPAPSINSKAIEIKAASGTPTEGKQPSVKPIKSTPPISIKRKVSPPPKTQPKLPVPTKVEKLIPRPVPKAGATLKVRLALVELLHKQIGSLNAQVNDDDTQLPNLKLSDQQIIKWVLDEEAQAAAKFENDIYRNTMTQKVLQLRKMKLEQWKTFVDEKINPSSSTDKIDEPIVSKLSSEEEIQVLRYLRTNLTGLDSHGYVTKAPSEIDIQKARDATKAAAGYELCDRCGVRFQVFPGRDDQGRLTTKGECHYHWAKLNRGQFHKSDHITGQAPSSYPCCGQLPGSEGCTQAPTHVFKVTDPKRLAALLQFEQTPVKSDGKKRGPLAFDCEMAYTTYGLEVVRVTAVSWPQNKEVLDVLVRPFGEILDLNTRFSGVTPAQFTNAAPYNTAQDHNDNTSEEGELEPEPLRKVDSPAVARELLFQLLNPDTPLIGHAIDNDLNTCRIIHPFVIDTVLLYPHPRGLPIRYGLKMLAAKYLQRNIQSGGDAGHDSKEDSVATGDLVKVKVSEKWQMMRLQGWNFKGDNLVPPGR